MSPDVSVWVSHLRSLRRGFQCRRLIKDGFSGTRRVAQWEWSRKGGEVSKGFTVELVTPVGFRSSGDSLRNFVACS